MCLFLQSYHGCYWGSGDGAAGGADRLFCRLCTTICKNVRYARASGNAHLVLCSRQRQHSHQNGQNSEFAVEMTLGGTYSGILPNDCCPSHRAWKPAPNAGSHISTATTTAGWAQRQRPTPLKSGALTDSCTEPDKQIIRLRRNVLFLIFLVGKNCSTAVLGVRLRSHNDLCKASGFSGIACDHDSRRRNPCLE